MGVGGKCFDQGAEGLLYSERVSKKMMGGCCTKAAGVFYKVMGNGPERRCRESSVEVNACLHVYSARAASKQAQPAPCAKPFVIRFAAACLAVRARRSHFIEEYRPPLQEASSPSPLQCYMC